MSSQEKSPACNEAPKDKSVTQILIDLANDKYESWKQFLTIESSRFLGKRLAVTDATVAGLVRDNEIHRASNKNLHDRLLHVEQMCADLCRKNNQSYHALIKLKEDHNKFIDETNAKLRSKGIT